MSCIGNSLLCVTAVTVVCSCEICCAECWSWVLLVCDKGKDSRYWTVLTAIIQKLLLHVQLHNRRESVELMSFEVDCSSCLELYVYMDNHLKRLDTSNSRYWLQAQCCNFHSDKKQVDVTKITDTLCKLMYCQCQVLICVNIYRKTLNFIVTNWQCS